MFSKFKNNESVIVNGFGKCNNQYYKNKVAVVICRDPYYGDYNIKFENGTEDWVDEKFLRKFKRRNRK